MNAKSKMALLAAFAAALLAGPVSAQAAQHKQAKQLNSHSGKTVQPYTASRTAIPAGRVYLLENREFGNSKPVADFQDGFRIGY